MQDSQPDAFTLSTFTAADGSNLAVYDWAVEPGVATRGTVLVVHGLGEHAGRYNRLARRLASWGFAVRAYDQCGHGDSDGARGVLPSRNRLLSDLADMVDHCRSGGGAPPGTAGKPLVLLGHSMGGAIAARLVSRGLKRVDGLVLSSPAFDPGLRLHQRALLAVLSRWAPNLTVGNGLNPRFLSHDADMVAAYRADPRVHDRVSARLIDFIVDSGQKVQARARYWTVPTLLLYAGDDRLVNARGSDRFARNAPRMLVASERLEGLFHEIFNETMHKAVDARLEDWLEARFPRP